LTFCQDQLPILAVHKKIGFVPYILEILMVLFWLGCPNYLSRP